MSRSLDWRSYVDENGEFSLAEYLYSSILHLMKSTLDMGTLLSSDDQRLRAYKEQIKTMFKGRWLEMAKALEYFDIIVPCGCSEDDFCRYCGGSRYRLNSTLTPDQMQEIAVVVSHSVHDDPKIQKKLKEGLDRALREVEDANLS